MLPKPILLSRDQISDLTWDNHIHDSQQCVIYALSWYLDIVCEKWEALVWPAAADFSIAMPLPVTRKFGKRVLDQPLFCQYLGIFSKRELTEAQCKAFVQAVAEHFSYISNYAFNPDNFAPFAGLPHCLEMFDYEVFQTHWLDLGRRYEELYGGYSRDRKVNLKKGLSANWEVVESDDFAALIRLFMENHAERIGKIKAGAYQMLEQLGESCLDHAAGRLLYARTGSRVHAGMLLAHYRRRTIYLFNAADNLGRKGNARMVMLDAWFRENADAKSLFDFESPQIGSIARYYASFGATAKPFYCIMRNALPFPFRQIQQLRKWLLIRTS